MAGVAGKAPYVKSRVWLVSKGPHGVKSIPYEDTVVRRSASDGSTVLFKRLDDDRYALKVTAAAAYEQVVGRQSETMGGTQGGGPAHVGRSRSGTTNNTYAPRTSSPRTAGLHRPKR